MNTAMSTNGPAVQRYSPEKSRRLRSRNRHDGVAAQRMAAAERRHERERNAVARRAVGGRSERAQRDHPVLAKNRDEPLRLRIDAPEAVRAAVGLTVVGELHPVESTASRVVGRRARVDLDERVRAGVVRIERRWRRIGRRHPCVRRDRIDAAAERQQPGGANAARNPDCGRAKQEVSNGRSSWNRCRDRRGRRAARRASWRSRAHVHPVAGHLRQRSVWRRQPCSSGSTRRRARRTVRCRRIARDSRDRTRSRCLRTRLPMNV